MRKPSAGLEGLFANPRFQLGLLIFTAITLFFAKLAGTGLMAYDDGFYADKAKEMLQHHSFLTVYYNGQPGFDNPPFFFWLEILAYKVFGIGEYGAVFPSAVLGVLTMIVLYLLTRSELGPRPAFFTALVLITTPHWLKWSRHAMVDVTLTFTVTLALAAFYLAPKRHRALYLVWGLGIAAGILTKSVLGTFALWIALAYLVLSGQWRELRSIWFWLGLLLASALGSIWYVHEYMSFQDLFIQRHFRDLLMSKAMAKESDYDLIYHLKYVLFPAQYIPHWVLFMVVGLILSVRRAWARERFALLTVLWLVIVTALLSVSLYKKTWYLMPAVPALAVMGGIGLNFVLEYFSRQTEKTFAKIVMGVTVISLGFNVLAMGTPLPLAKEREVDMREFAPFVKVMGESGFKLTGYKIDYFGVNNASLFYSDFAFAPVFEDPAKFVEDFTQPGPRGALIPHDHLAEIKTPYKILKDGDDYVLISNQDVDFSKVRFLKSRVLK